MCLIIKHKISEIIIYVDTFTEIGKGLESCDLLYYLDLYFGELFEDKRVPNGFVSQPVIQSHLSDVPLWFG